MRERLQRRLDELTTEYEAGQVQLRDLEASLLRISGAIIVLRELLEAEDGEREARNGALPGEPLVQEAARSPGGLD